MAELSPEEKDAISHRGRAARALVERLIAADEELRQRTRLGGGRRRLRRGDALR